MSISLQQLQEVFQAYMLEGDKSILNEIINTPLASAELRMDVYRDAYYLRLIDILAMDYSVLKEWVGEETFSELASDYIDAYPSNQFSIRIFGRHFSKFLATHATAAPILKELATFEWKIAEVLDAADAPHITFEDVTKIPPESWGEMEFVLHPSIQIVPFFFNTPELWRALKEEQTPPEVIQQEIPITWLFWRFNHEAYFISINEPQLAMLQLIQSNKNFGEICEDLTEFFAEEEVVQFAAGTLRSWVDQGIFSAVKLVAN